MTPEVGAKAQIPNPALQPFVGLVGKWRTSGAHPAVPGVTLHGRVSFGWQEGGAFLVWRSQVDHPLFPDGVAIFGSDDDAKTWFISYFDERTISRKYDVTVTPDGFSMQRLTPKFSQRMTYVIEPGGNRIVSRGEMSRDRGAWEADLSLTYDRLK